MLVGDKNLFAIEWQTRCVIKNKSHFNLRFWSSNIPIGDFEDDVMDSIVIGYLKEFLINKTLRAKYDSSGKNSHHTYEVIYQSVFDSIDKKYTDEVLALQQEVPSFIKTFHLTDVGGTAFDDIGIFSCNTGKAGERLIWKVFSTNQLYETKLPMDYIEDVIKEFLDTIEHNK